MENSTYTVAELQKMGGQTVTINGWIDTVRNMKKMQFIVLRDHTGLLQITHPRSSSEKLSQIIETLTPESTVKVTGVISINPQVKTGGLELILEELEIYALAQTPLPINESASSESRLDWRFLDLRSRKNRLVFQVQTVAELAMREFWNQRGFIEIHSPKMMGSASESGAELFTVEYFDGKAYLAQSPQFYKQMAMAAGFNRIYEIGPVFRANPSHTSRHDTEFTSVDVEMSWIQSHEDVMAMEEQWLHFILNKVKSELGEEIKELFDVDIVVPSLPFPRVTMDEAYRILSDMGYEVTRAEKGDLDPEGERTLAKHIREVYGHEFVFVTDYPASVRAFYHMRHDHDPNVTKSFDLIWKGLEVTTGAQREHRYDRLVKQAMEKGIGLDSVQYYLDFFRYGVPPHGGYGFGLTRMLMIMLGMKNVREVTYLYRGVNRLTP